MGRWGSCAQATHCREGEAGFNVFPEGTMGDTQRSQPISTENWKIAKQALYDPALADRESGGPPLLIGESSLARIEVMARTDPEMVFTSLAHRIDLSLLKSIISEAMRAAKLLAGRGVAWPVEGPVKRAGTEEPDEGKPHVRICGEGAG